MNVSTAHDQRFQRIANSASNHLLSNSISVMTERPAYMYESFNSHISAATLHTSGETDTVNGNHEHNLVCANDTVPIASQLNLVQYGTEFCLEDYPMQLYSEAIVEEPVDDSHPDGVAVNHGSNMDIDPTECHEILEPDSNFPLHNIRPEKKMMPKNKITRNHSQFKRNRSQANTKPLLPSFASNQQPTLYFVVGPGKICGRLLLNNISGNSGGILEKTANDIALPRPVQQNSARRAPEDRDQEINSSKRPRREHFLNTAGVQTRSGRLSKPPQVLTDGFVCRLIKEPHVQQQQPSCENDTFREKRFRLEENKENPWHDVESVVSVTTRRKAKVQPQYQCGTCHKTYLGRRMARHLLAYPTHVTLDKLEAYKTQSMDSIPDVPASSPPTPVLHDPTLAPPSQLYRLLVDLVTAPEKESNQRDVLLGEISQFVGLVRSRVPSLIVPSEQEDNETVYIDQNVADVLQLNPGNYRIRMATFVQEREKFLGIGGLDNNKSRPANPVSDAAEQKKDPVSVKVSSERDFKITSESSFEALLQDIAELEQREQQGLLEPLPLPTDRNDYENPNANLETMGSTAAPRTATTAFNEPAVMSNQGSMAFGRLYQLSEELFPSQSQGVLRAFEELTNLSELCTPQALGVPGGVATNESSSALAFE